MTKKIIVAVLFIFCTYFPFAQSKVGFPTSESKLKLQKQIMGNAAFVFEGIATSQKSYRTAKYGILTCTVFEIKKIFKGSGQIKLGTIKVISLGGTIPEENPDNKERVLEGSSAGEDISIAKGVTYIIFAPLADSSGFGNANSPVTTLVTDNTIVLGVRDLIILNRMLTHYKSHNVKNPEKLAANENAAEWFSVETYFKTLDELYTFLKDNGGLTVQEEKK